MVGCIHDQPAGAERGWHCDIHDSDATALAMRIGWLGSADMDGIHDSLGKLQ
jgi:hypothetical protein